MPSRLNLNHLAALVAVQETGGFRAAAERLHVTQSAVSGQIRMLEERLGVSLFDRTTRSVRLTDEGSRLYAVARRMDADVAQAIEDLRAGSALERGRVEIACTGSIAASLLPSVIVAFGARHPGIVFKVQDVDSPRVLALIKAGEVDCGILSSLGAQRGVGIEPLFQDEFVAVVPASKHPLCKRAKVSLRELCAFPILLNPKGAILRDLVDAALHKEGLNVTPVHEAYSGLTLVGMVGEGLGVTILPALSLHGLDLGNCRVLDFTRGFHRQIVAAWPEGRRFSPATGAFLHFLRQKAQLLRPRR